MKNCTRSVINPTTGMTIGCCYGRATKDNDVRLMCIIGLQLKIKFYEK